MKEVFVFGAGASYASAGIPSGQDLAWQYYADCSDMHEISTNGTPVLEEETIEFKNFRSFLELSEIIFPELNGIVERWEQDRRQSILNTPWYSGVKKDYCVDHFAEILLEQSNLSGLELIRQIVLEHITKVAINSYGNNNSLYNQFIAYRIKKYQLDFSIICFNFDTQLMIESRNQGFPFDYVIKFDKETPFNSLSQNKIPVYKLHGSLDWAFCPACKKIGWLSPWVKKESYYCSCGLTAHCLGNPKPFIFLPHESKEDELITFLRNEVAKKLQEADKVTIVGYSFPEYDKLEQDLFKKNLQPSVLLEIVDVLPEDEIREKYKRMFPDINNIKICSTGFEGYVKNLCS